MIHSCMPRGRREYQNIGEQPDDEEEGDEMDQHLDSGSLDMLVRSD